jgi:hypothetical protein
MRNQAGGFLPAKLASARKGYDSDQTGQCLLWVESRHLSQLQEWVESHHSSDNFTIDQPG